MAYSSKFTDSVLNKKKKQVEYESKYTKQVLSDTYVPYLDQINKSEIFNYNEIAPVKIETKSVSKKEEDKKWYQKIVDVGAFSDGYDFGDITKTVLGTATNVATDIIKAPVRIGEGLGDAIGYGSAAVLDAFGNEKKADEIRKKASESLTDKWFNGVDKFTDKTSVLGETTDAILEGVGYVGSIVATSGLGSAAGLGAGGTTALTTGLTATSGFGSGTSEAYQMGATDEEAYKYGIISGAAESLSELLFGGLGKGARAVGLSKGIGGLDDILITKATKNIDNILARNLAQGTLKASGEGLEEVIAGTVQALGKKATYMSEEDLMQILEDEKLLEQFIIGGITSSLVQTKGVVDSTKQGRDFVTGYTNNEQTVINKEVESRIAEIEQGGTKLSNKEKSKIEEQVRNDLEKGYISTDRIESVLGGEEYNTYKSVLDKQNRYNELLDKNVGETTNREKAELDALTKELEQTDINTLKSKLDNSMGQKISSDGLLQRSYQEKANKGVQYQADLTKYDAKQQKTIQKAIDSGILNNTNKTHEFIDMIAKISADKDIDFDFTNNENLKNSGFAVEGKTVNGFINENGITLNMDSNKALNKVVGHEITHVLEGTELYSELQEMVKEYATTKGEYDTRLNALKELYKDIDNANVENELTADLIGDYLFTDTDFVNNLSTTKPNVFKKIYNEIKHLYKLATAGSKEARELEKVKKIFETAYEQNITYDINQIKKTTHNDKAENTAAISIESSLYDNNISQNEDIVNNSIFENEKSDTTKYSIGGLKAINSLPDSKYKQDALNDYKNALYLANNNVDNERIRKETKWFKDKNGDWKFEFTDEYMKLKDNVVLSKNSTYELEDILKHNYLFNLYPQLKNYKVVFKDKKNGAGGSYNEGTHTISVNNDNLGLANSKQIIEGVLIHEIQHAIQSIEGFEKGRSSKLSKLAYLKSLGEIEATDTRSRFDQKLTKDDRLNIAPESSKSNPKHKSLDKYLKNRNIIDKIKDNLYNLTNGGNTNVGSNQEYNQNNQGKFDRLVDGREGRGYVNSESFFDRENTNFSLSETDLKQKQLNIVLENNPVNDDYHTWIRSVEDIKTFEETLQDSDWEGWEEDGFDPSYTGNMASEALKTGKITVYSSYPINLGIFVSPSKMEAESYSSNGKVYSKEVNLTDVAWIDPTQGQYAPVGNETYSLSNQGEQIVPSRNDVFGSDIKLQEVIAPLQEEIQTLIESENELKEQIAPPTSDKPTSAKEWKEKAKKRTIEQKVEDTIRKQSYKNAVSTSMYGKKLINLNEQERRTFRDNLLELTTKRKEQLTNADDYNNVRQIIRKFADREYDYIDKTLRDAKRDVRSYRIKVDEKLKKQITDYGDFRKENFGNLNLALDGRSIDSVWQELNERYPYYFTDDVYSEADMLYQLADFMKQDVTITEKYRLSDKEIEGITSKIYNKIVQNALSSQDLEFTEQDITTQIERRTRQVVQNELLEEMGITDDILLDAKHINQIDLSRTDPIRVNEKIFGWKNGQKVNDATINTTIRHEAERIRFLNQERNEIKELGIKARSKESAAVQKYGEKQYVNEVDEVVPYGDKELIAEFSDVETQEKIKRAAQILRNKYDTYIDIVNNELERMGYDPIPKRKDYMRHFQEMSDIFSKLGTPLNPTALNENNLPTDINGLTDEFKPGKSWFANAQQRKGMKTVYDAITGIDGYLESVSNVIYHTEDIQRYRTLAKHIRTMFSEKALEDYDVLRDEERIEAFDKAYKGQNGFLAQYVSWLDEQANALAGKKGKIDRGFEETFGRKAYTVLNDAKKQVGSNMTGFNVRSSMTNFASAVQGLSKTKKIPFVKGLYSTFDNIIKKDGLIDKSNFLTTRFGSEQLSKKTWQKVSNYGQIFMTGTDYFTANLIWRSKYFENLSSGMSEDVAIKNADDFAARVMGNRAKGTTATIFNSKTLGLFTQFQLEMNNYWSNVIHDNKMEIEKGQIEGKTGKVIAGVVFNLGQLAVFSNIFNTVMRSLTGSDVMFDPVELLKKLIGGDDDEEEKLTDKVGRVFGEVIDDLPFISTFTGGGRIPSAEAFIGLAAPIKAFTKKEDEYGQEYEWEDAWKEFFDSGMYWVLPTGYGQLKKTYKGLSMYDKDLPVAGSYTDSGNLRFTTDEDLPSKIKSGLFGQYANEEAQKYIDSGFETIKKNNIEELVDLGMTSTEYRKYRNELKKAGTKNEDKLDYINSLDLPIRDKNIMANNVLDRDYDVDMSDYTNYEEFDFSYKSPEKYEWLNENNISYSEYATSKETKEVYNWAYNNPESYTVSKAVTDDLMIYKEYKDAIYDIEADKDSKGDSIRGTRKENIISYVNSLDLSIPQKAILIKSTNTFKFNDYNYDIVEYVGGLDIPYKEKVTILKELEMTVQEDGTVKWK